MGQGALYALRRTSRHGSRPGLGGERGGPESPKRGFIGVCLCGRCPVCGRNFTGTCSLTQGYCDPAWTDVTSREEIKPWGLESSDVITQGEPGKRRWEKIGLLLRVLLWRS